MALIKLQATFLDAIFKQGVGDPVREPRQPTFPICPAVGSWCRWAGKEGLSSPMACF